MTREIKKTKALVTADPLQRYIQEVQRYPYLTLEEEMDLARRYHERGDPEAARQLVQAHLRLVVKIAMEYRRSYFNILDLIQEGSVGLLHAVKKFDPSKGARLSYYASLWIRSYILKYILDNFRPIKIGTTKDQRKLFFNLMREKQKIEAMGYVADSKTLSERLKVKVKTIEEMQRRLTTPEYALEGPAGKGEESILMDFIPMDEESVEETVAKQETKDILKETLGKFVKDLNKRDQAILQQRLLSDLPITLQEIADEYGITKERVRQLESRLLDKLRDFLKEAGVDKSNFT